jgi:hypothetical protein
MLRRRIKNPHHLISHAQQDAKPQIKLTEADV